MQPLYYRKPIPENLRDEWTRKPSQPLEYPIYVNISEADLSPGFKWHLKHWTWDLAVEVAASVRMGAIKFASYLYSKCRRGWGRFAPGRWQC